MEFPSIENVYYVTQSSGTSKIWGVPIPLFTGLLSTFVTLFVFALGWVGQYLTNRKREIKKLHAYRECLIYILTEMRNLTSIYKQEYKNYAQEMREYSVYRIPTFKHTNKRENLVEAIDKKECIYLFNRWTKNNEINYAIVLLNIFATVSDVEFAIDFIKAIKYDDVKDLDKEFQRRHDEHKNYFAKLYNNPESFGLSKENADFISDKIIEYAQLRDEVNGDAFLSMMLDSVLENKTLCAKGLLSGSDKFLSYWLNMIKLKDLLKQTQQKASDTIEFYERGAEYMETLKTYLDNLIDSVNNMKVKKQISFN